MIGIARALWPYLRPHKRMLAVAVAAMAGETAMTLLTPWPLKFVFDRLLIVHHGQALRLELGSAQWLLLALLTAAGILIAALGAVFSYIDTQYSEIAAQRAVFDLRRVVFSHLQRLSVAYHHSSEMRLGDLLSRLSGDIGALQDLAAESVSSLVTNGLTLVLMAVLIFVLDPLMGAVVVVLTVPTAIYARRNTLVMRQAMRVARRSEGAVSALLQESLAHVKLVQAYTRERHEESRLRSASEESLTANIYAATLSARLAPAVAFMSSVAYALLIAVGVWRVVSGHLTPGGLLVLLNYARGTQSPIRQLAKISYVVSKATAGLERIREVLDVAPSVAERPGARALALSGPPAVRFEAIGFGYGPARPVLHDVTLDAAAGELVAIVGATGSGKSTLLSLLPRFYDPAAGRVTIDGHDVRDVTLDSLRRQIAVVLQDSLILRTTVLENIRYGRPDATREEAITAAIAAGVSRVVTRLEDGYDTVVSERGASLSGGEKQCVGIARAMVKGAPVVILDEPTSAMDAHTERLVMEGIERLLANRTGFIIAHRLSTVMKADRVAVMDAGRIVECGPPAALLSDPGSRFSALAAAQLAGPAVPVALLSGSGAAAARRSFPAA